MVTLQTQPAGWFRPAFLAFDFELAKSAPDKARVYCVSTQIPAPSKEFVLNRVTMRFQLILPLQGTYGVTAGAGGTMKFAW